MFALGRRLYAMCSSNDTEDTRPSFGHSADRKEQLSALQPESDGDAEKWKLTNIGGIGSDEDKELREKAAESQEEFEGAGQEPGIEIWRIEKFNPKKVDLRCNNLSLYSGDCYIVLKTFFKDDSETLDWQLHYWIGKDSTQDESGSAAYFTVNLDDLLDQKPVQYRELQYSESKLFHSHFKSVTYLDGGIDSGFTTAEPEVYQPRLLQMTAMGGSIRVLQVPLSASSLNDGDVFILDNGMTVYQFNGAESNVKERVRAMEIVNEDIRAERDGEPELVVLDGEEVFDCDPFWELLGGKVDELPSVDEAERDLDVSDEPDFAAEKKLFKISNESGELEITKVAEGEQLSADDVDNDDIWVVASDNRCFIHVGSRASTEEKMFVWSNCDAVLVAAGLEEDAQTIFFSKESNMDMWMQCFS